MLALTVSGEPNSHPWLKISWIYFIRTYIIMRDDEQPGTFLIRRHKPWNPVWWNLCHAQLIIRNVLNSLMGDVYCIGYMTCDEWSFIHIHILDFINICLSGGSWWSSRSWVIFEALSSPLELHCPPCNRDIGRRIIPKLDTMSASVDDGVSPFSLTYLMSILSILINSILSHFDVCGNMLSGCVFGSNVVCKHGKQCT